MQIQKPMSITIKQALSQIQPISLEKLDSAQVHPDSLTKPPGCLGRLEELARRYVAIRGMNLMVASVMIYSGMATFQDAGVSTQK